jgi:hypothetical protein
VRREALGSFGGTTIPLALQSLAGSSNLPGGFGRAVLPGCTDACAPARQSPPYLVLLRAGFCLPSVLPRTRCALTAPFHPYLSTHPFGVRSRQAPACDAGPALSEPRRGESKGGIFSVPLIRQVTLPGRYPAHCPSEFGLSSPPATSRLPAVDWSSDRLADCDTVIISYVVSTRTCARISRASLAPPALAGSRRPPVLLRQIGGRRSVHGPGGCGLTVHFLLDAVLFELLVEVATRRVDYVRGLRDVPAILAKLLHQERAFSRVLELAQGPG